MELERLGGLVTKAVSLEPRRGNPPPRVSEFAGGMINSVGLANPGLGSVRHHELPWLAAHLTRAQVLVNVVGFREEEYAAVVSGLDDSPGFAGYELNLSCPNTAKGGIEFGAEPDAVGRIVEPGPAGDETSDLRQAVARLPGRGDDGRGRARCRRGWRLAGEHDAGLSVQW